MLRVLNSIKSIKSIKDYMPLLKHKAIAKAFFCCFNPYAMKSNHLHWCFAINLCKYLKSNLMQLLEGNDFNIQHQNA